MTLAIPIRKFYRLEDFITMKHLDNMAKVILATGLIVCYGYAMEAFFAWYSGNAYERFMIINRMFGQYAWSYWCLIACNLITPQFLWSKRIRRSVPALLVICLVVNVGMWLERFVIVVTSLARDYLPSSWDVYVPTRWDFALYLGTLGLFVFLLLLFIRFLPMISIFEMRTLVPATGEEPIKPPRLEVEP
jgi:molybdopterin-containing oxidoreductase family membrane subunit